MRVLVLALAVTLTACGTEYVERGEAPADSRVRGELGFMNQPGLTRTGVTARLGEPSDAFEGGHVVSYSLGMHPTTGKLSVVGATGCYALVIEYGAGDVVSRYSLIQHRSYPCAQS